MYVAISPFTWNLAKLECFVILGAEFLLSRIISGTRDESHELGKPSRWHVCFCALETYQTITGADGGASLDHCFVPHFAQEVALGGPGQRPDPGSSQATVPSLRHEARRQQVRVEGEVEAQAALAVPQLVEDSIRVGRSPGGFPALQTTSVVRQEVGQEATSGIHSCRVNQFIWRQFPQN